jgi:hypothetical protein
MWRICFAFSQPPGSNRSPCGENPAEIKDSSSVAFNRYLCRNAAIRLKKRSSPRPPLSDHVSDKVMMPDTSPESEDEKRGCKFAEAPT